MLQDSQSPSVPVENRFNDLPNIARLGKGREWTYFLRADCPDRLVKIGNSINLKWRLAGLQTQSPVQLSLIGLVDSPAGAEFLFHEALASSRAHGEWFRPTADLERLRKALPKAGRIEGPELVALMADFGVSKGRAYKTMLTGLTRHKHASKRGTVEAPEVKSIGAMFGMDPKDIEELLSRRLAEIRFFDM
jgi:T5orf172 domain